jgi:small basic protein (TIGR04137 family)
MSLNKTLKSKATLARHRNVLSRAERIDRMKELGTWREDMNALGLPKVSHRKAKVGKKEKAPKETAPGAAPAAEAGKPAADAAAGKSPAAKAPAAKATAGGKGAAKG